jgi:mobilome CxxCx(11)CxxC protein
LRLVRLGKAGRQDDAQANALRSRCWDDAFHATATAYIFQRRARRLGKLVQVITYVGFAVPMLVGLLVLGYTQLKSLPVIAGTAAGIGIAQAVLSLWAIVGGWVVGGSYAAASASANEVLAGKFATLASSPPSDFREFRQEYELAKVESRARDEQDLQQGVTEAELRRGMRAALRKYRKGCAACNKVPVDMKATDCPVCGKFRNWMS